MKDAIHVGQSYHFWLNEEDDIYDLLYGEPEDTKKEEPDHESDSSHR